MTFEETIEKLVKLAPPIIAANGYPGPPFAPRGRCIASTRIGIEVLKAFDIKAAPVPVNTRVMNAAFYDAAEKRISWDKARELGAWLVEIDVKGEEGLGDAGWPGHLVIGILAHDLLVDLDLAQFHRPAKSIHVPAAGVFPVNDAWWTKKKEISRYALEGGAQLFQERLQVCPDFRVSGDWSKPSRWWRSVRKIVKAMGGNADALVLPES